MPQGLFGGAITCDVSQFVAVVAADFVLSAAAAAAPRTVARPVISATTSKHIPTELIVSLHSHCHEYKSGYPYHISHY